MKNWKQRRELKRSQEYKEQLGMGVASATGKLRKLLLYEFARRLNLISCYRCHRTIESIDEFTVDHKKNWLHKSADLFWDIDNIAFSHFVCNTTHNRTAEMYKHRTNKKCNECGEVKAIKSFGKHKQGSEIRIRSYCNQCRSIRKKQGRSY